jgi:predicted small lipoprotein YifL
MKSFITTRVMLAALVVSIAACGGGGVSEDTPGPDGQTVQQVLDEQAQVLQEQRNVSIQPVPCRTTPEQCR